MDRLVSSFEAARLLGFTQLVEKPAWGARVKNAQYRRDLNALQAAISRGTVPEPDTKRGRTNLWRLSSLTKFIAKGGKKRGKGADDEAA